MSDRLKQVERERDEWERVCKKSDAAYMKMYEKSPCGKHQRRFWVDVATPDPEHGENHVSVASYCSECVKERLIDENKKLRAVVDAARRDLQSAIDFATEGWAYASDYFKDKWGYAEQLKELQDALAAVDTAKK